MSGTDVDILICRIVDNEATDADWAQFRSTAETDPRLWQQLAECQRDHTDLVRAVAPALAAADRVEAPVRQHMAWVLSLRARTVATWGGWAAAGAVALAWMGVGMPGVGESASQTAGPSFSSPADLLHAYIDRGKQQGTVIGEMPEKIVISAEPAATGQRVYYIRPILEVGVFTDMYRFDQDEAGRRVPVRINTIHQARGWY